MPKGILKRFEDTDKHSYYYYDVEKRIIGTRGYAKSTNTQEDFYSDIVEKYLKQDFEDVFFPCLKIIDEISVDPPRGILNEEFDYSVKRFVSALIARDPTNIDWIRDHYQLSFQWEDQQYHDYAMLVRLTAELEANMLHDWGVTIAINNTSTPFILPVCGIYYVELHGIKHILFPVSPKRSVVLVEPHGKERVIKDGIVHPYLLESTDFVNLINASAVYAQVQHKKGWVVSPTIEAIENAVNWKNADL